MGIVGLGYIGIVHAGTVNSLGHKVVAFSDKDKRLLRLASSVVSDVRFYDDYEKMVTEENLDAVFVCTPLQTHAKVISDIVGVGKKLGIFVEKPLRQTMRRPSTLRT